MMTDPLWLAKNAKKIEKIIFFSDDVRIFSEKLATL
jgi:hypothetical protein